VAHALEPGYLELSYLAVDEWRVTWRRPQVAGRPMPIEAVLPQNCSTRRGGEPVFDGRAFLTGWVTRCDGGLAGGEISIEGLQRTRTDVLVRYTLKSGDAPQAARLTPQQNAFVVPPPQGRMALAGSYFVLGVDHILLGVDHLLFVLLLLLLIRDRGRLIGAITAFTVAHSLSLAAASLGWIVVPAPPVEAVVALSIVVLAAELAQPPGRGMRLTERFPWAIAFAFGLLHGLGFARALLDIGLPQEDVPIALLSFNVGVEVGQLSFIAAVLVVGGLMAGHFPAVTAAFQRRGRFGPELAAYGVGSVAAFWFAERVASFWL
jgi:hydrogenase/urease accessory protein HupE